MKTSSIGSGGGARQPVEMAETLFDNESEWPDELAFARGDRLRVLERRADGWWMCEDAGRRRGIAPANRLRLLPPTTTATMAAPFRYTAEPYMSSMRVPSFYNDHNDFPASPSMAAPVFGARAHTGTFMRPSGLMNNHTSMSSSYLPPPTSARFADPPLDFARLSVESDRPIGVIRNVPIRILNRQESAPTLVPQASAPVVVKRGPVPPPPQRRYFNVVATNGGVDDWTERGGGNRMTVGNVQWHSPANDKHNVTTTPVTATTLNNRSSNFITPPSSDERPSPAGSQQGGPNASSPRSSTLSDHSTEPHGDTGATTSVLMNALEQLYDTPNKMFDEQPARAPLTITNRIPQGRPPISPDRSPTPTTSANHNYSMIVKQPRPPLSIATAAAAEAKTTAATSIPTTAKVQPASIGTHLASQTRANPVAIASTSTQRQDSTQSAASNISKKTVTFSTMNKIETPQTSTTLITPDAEPKQNAKTTTKGSIIKNKTTTAASPVRTPFVQSVHEQAARIEVHCTYLSTTSGNTRQWRQPQILSANLHEIHTVVDELCHQLYLYIHGVTQASKTSGRSVCVRAHTSVHHAVAAAQVYPLKNSMCMLTELRDALNKSGWSLAVLVRRNPESTQFDALDQFVAVAKQVQVDVTRVTQWIDDHQSMYAENPVQPAATNGHSELRAPEDDKLDEQHSPLPEDRPLEEHELMSDAESLFEDYDFIDEVRPTSSITTVVEEPRQTRKTSATTKLAVDQQDMDILQMHLTQIDSHMTYLSTSIEEFFTCVERGRPPTDFIGKGKLVILSAHKLVYIGDTLAACVHQPQVASALRTLSDRLCSALKECVTATKNAADHYPAMSALQAMVDAMLAVSNTAHSLKMQLRKYVNECAVV